jgi:imidazolonepropionase-like amidohydrolase
VGGADAWRVAELLKARDVPVVITSVHRLPLRRDDDIDAPFRLAAQLAAAGVRFAIARGGSSSNERRLPLEAATAAAHGLPREEALKAITLYPAQILGVADRLGTLEVGKLASFIVTDGDPLETKTNIERLFVQGREVSAANRQTRLVERYRERPVQR